MLDEYERALAHAKTQPVVAHHGVVGEAVVRDWLATFLPKRFGVTSGFIRSQGFRDPYQSSHFDVIVYDQLEAPILWVEKNPDKTEGGRARIIPAENVGAIIEVKAAFNRQTVSEAAQKLQQLHHLMAGTDPQGERYPKYLPAGAILAMVFFELRRCDGRDLGGLNTIREMSVNRGFYGGVILRGEGLDADSTGRIQHVVSKDPIEPIFGELGLLQGCSMSGSTEIAGQFRSAMLLWSDVNFSIFAFDLLAMLKGTYQAGRASSLHGFDFRAVIKAKGQ